MKNLTLSADDYLIEEARRYAREHNTSLNDLIRQMLGSLIAREDASWVEGCFRAMDDAKGHSAGKRWTREDLHRA